MQNTKKLKVLLVSPLSLKKVGGIATWTRNLLNYIAENPQPIILKFQNTAMAIKGSISRGKFSRLFWGAIDSLLIILNTFYHILVFRPDVVHYTSSASIALFKDYIVAGICRLFHTKLVVHFHFGRIPELSQLNNWEWKWIKWVCRFADRVIVIDNASYEIMKAQNRSDKVFYIPNPVSQEIFDLAELMSESRNKRIEGKVVFVGHVVPAKGIFELVYACSELEEVKQLVVCGPYLEDTKKQLTRIASVRDQAQWLVFLGKVEHKKVIDELRDSLIFCLPSYTEGFPNAVMEAMAMSCSVVATCVGAIPEMLNFDTEIASGLKVKLRDTDSIRKALKRLIDDQDLAVRLGKNGNRKILEEYNLKTIFLQYYKVWVQ